MPSLIFLGHADLVPFAFLDEDKSFTAWPRSIHPEDYEKVMDAYREAFRTQTELRTEFRSLGSRHPWRLLLLTPLGDENLKHLSLGGHHGFICLIVDISSEKSAELAERKAAEEVNLLSRRLGFPGDIC